MGDQITLSDLFYHYPDQQIPDIQSEVAELKEFSSLATSARELLPPGGGFYRHQKIIHRLLTFCDRLLLIHRAGTGKTWSVFGFAEDARLLSQREVVDHVTAYASNQISSIRRVFLMVEATKVRGEIERQLAHHPILGETEQAKRRDFYEQGSPHGLLIQYPQLEKKLLDEGMHPDEVDQTINQQLVERFQGCMFVIDEIHNMIPSSTATKETEKYQLYQWAKRVFRVVPNLKVVGLTGSPIVNDVIELAAVIDLFNQVDMPTEFFSQLTVDNEEQIFLQMEPYFRGIVSYVKETRSDVTVHYVERTEEGEVNYYPNSVVIREGGVAEPVIYRDLMTGYQYDIYRRLSISAPLGQERRQASTMVFPEIEGFSAPKERVGNSAFTRFVDEEKGNYFFRPIVRTASGEEMYNPLVSNYQVLGPRGEVIGNTSIRFNNNPDALLDLRNYSTKFYNIIRIIHENLGRGVSLIHTEYKQSGTKLLGLLLEEILEFKRLRPKQAMWSKGGGAPTEEWRYAIIDGDILSTEAKNILDAVSHDNNAFGTYLAVIILNEAGQEGISINNVTVIQSDTSDWHPAGNYQAESRGLRATSHIRLATLLAPDPVIVDIYYHAAVYIDPDSGESESADITNKYLTALDKDLRIAPMIRFLKRVAIDYWLHLDRNMPPPEQRQLMDGSQACDYLSCNYPPLPIPEKRPVMGLKHHNHDLIYGDDDIALYSTIVVGLMMSKQVTSLDEIRAVIGKETGADPPPLLLARVLQQIILQPITIQDSLGRTCHLREDGPVYFLDPRSPVGQFDWSLRRGGSKDYHYLYPAMLGTSEDTGIPFHQRGQVSIQQTVLERQIEELNAITEIERMRSYIADKRKSLFPRIEQAVIAVKSTGRATTADRLLTEIFQNHIHYTPVPTDLIEELAMEKPGSKHFVDAFNEPMKDIILRGDMLGDGPPSVWHTIWSAISGASYNELTNIFNVEGTIRILQGGQFVDLIPAHRAAYRLLARYWLHNARAAALVSSRISLGDSPTIGILTASNTLRILTITLDKTDKTDKKITTKDQGRGVSCHPGTNNTTNANLIRRLEMKLEQELTGKDQCSKILDGFNKLLIQQGVDLVLRI